MKININPKPHFLFPAIYLFIVIHTIQVGVGLPGMQRIIYMEARQDSWISIIISGIATHIVMFFMISTLKKYPSADLYGIHQDVYGTWIGKIMSSFYLVYLLFALVVIFRSYIEIVQVWLFPELPTWVLDLAGMFLVSYGVLGGIRVIVGASLLAFFFTIWLVLVLYFPIQYAEWRNLLPLMDNPISDILKGAYKMSFTIIGFELIYFIYPFVKDKEKTQRYTQLSLLFTTLLYLFIMIVSLAYFSGEQLEKTVWATLSLFKIVQLPIIERFEIIAISLWMLVIIPNTLFYTYAFLRGTKRLFQFKAKYSLLFITAIVTFSNQMMKTRDITNKVFDFFGTFSFYIVFLYPLILYLLVLFKKRKRNKQGDEGYENGSS